MVRLYRRTPSAKKWNGKGEKIAEPIVEVRLQTAFGFRQSGPDI